MSGYFYDKNNKSGILAGIIAGICVLGITISVLALVIAFPTSKHREVAQQIDTLRGQVKDDLVVTELPQYKEIQATAEAKYSGVVSSLIVVVNTLFTITAIGVLYRYLRQSRIVKDAVLSTALLFTGAWAVVLLAAYLFETRIFMNQSFNWGELTVRELLNLTLGFLLCYIVARLFKKYFDRKHSFTLEK